MLTNKSIYVIVAGAVTAFVALLVAGSFYVEKLSTARKPVVGSQEVIRIKTSSQTVEIVAKIDTGADFSSIDKEFAKSIGLDISSARAKTVITATGQQKREVIDLSFTLGNQLIATEATVADRAALSTDVLVGRNDLSRFIIDPSQEFLTRPGSSQAGSVPLFQFLNSFVITRPEKILIVFPILGALIVLERLLIGFRTYGMFAPVVIAFSLLQIGIIEGIAIYLALVFLGLALKIIMMKKLQLPHISEMSLLMFFLSGALLAFEFYPATLPTLSVTAVFFPLIITSHLIESAGKTVEEHRISEAIPLLFSTLAAAALLAAIGTFLFRAPTGILWIIFTTSIAAVIAASYYRGLRLTELIRFRLNAS